MTALLEATPRLEIREGSAVGFRASAGRVDGILLESGEEIASRA